nr:ankyrin repeat domain-containing protein 10 [Nothobranchius furzeri]
MSVGVGADLCGDEVFFSRFPVHRACRDGDLDALMSLSKRTHLNAEDSCYGWTPIHWAAHYGQLECVVYLVQMGCKVNTATSRFNQTPTHAAALGGHPHCVVWLTQAGADINKQDLVGEAPIHKAARSGSLECIQVLLIAGAEPHLRNASGQTAADLAHAHGFHDCFCFISNTPTHREGAPLSRKRTLPTKEACNFMKKARRAEVLEQQVVQSSSGEEEENMDLSSDDITRAGLHHSPSSGHNKCPSSPPSPPPTSAEMCGSLHLSSSPGRSGSHQLRGVDCGDFLLYGHYHGFGDTAEDLSDSCEFQTEGGYKQPGHAHLYLGS